MVTIEYDFLDGTSGYVNLVSNFFGNTYTASTGWSAQAVRYFDNRFTGTFTEKRAMFRLDTRQIPHNAQITAVEFKIVDSLIQSPPFPLSYGLRMGSDFIGSSLDGNSAEFTGGKELYTVGFTYTSGTYFNLPTTSHPLINKGGYTCFNLHVDAASTNTDYNKDFNTSRSKCKFRITYEIPGIPFKRLRNPRLR